ncbi:MAG: carbon monoxide dehydrogenase subunit G [Bryobacterales bacterium]|nr:carbon monoxide dehydrogenase subunit G [Bryobacterales bacterium]
MHIEGSFTLSAGQERVYAALLDPAVLAACIPGCQELVDTGNSVYTMKMKVALAALSGDFVGKVAIEDPQPPVSYRMRIEGSGRIGILRGDGDLRLAEAGDGGTEVRYRGEVHVGGTIAAVGQRLLDTTARMMIKRFFETLAARLAKGESQAAGT